MKTILLLTLALLAGCSTGRIKTPGGISVIPPKEASAPSSVREGQKVISTTIPAGTVVVKEAISPTKESPAIERETTTYTAPSQRVETQVNSEITVAPPRVPDQSVALRNADNKARAPMLYASIGALFLTGIFLYGGKLELAAVTGSIAAALALCWYAFGNPIFMVAALVLVVCGVGFLIWRKHKKASITEEALRRTIQTVEEIAVDNPEIAGEIMEYQSSNMDSMHKKLIQEIRPTISYKYIRERLAKHSLATK